MTTHDKLKLAVLLSGQGSNMLAIAHACAAGAIHADIATVIADREAPGLAAAYALHLPTYRVAAPSAPVHGIALEAALEQAIDVSGAQLVVLAGFMRILSTRFVQRYSGCMLNIHPSLLPRHKGLHTHRRVLQAGELVHGASVHYVTDELDGGPVAAQARLTVRPDDSESTLRARVQALEHRLYPHVLGLIAAGRMRLDGATIRLDGQAMTTPLLLDATDGADATLGAEGG